MSLDIVLYMFWLACVEVCVRRFGGECVLWVLSICVGCLWFGCKG